MVVPVKYRGGGESVIASYDFQDIASGVGYEAFYLMVSNNSGALTYALTPNSNFYSYKPETVATTSATTTYNFDSSPFNLPKTVKGTAILNIGIHPGDGYEDIVTAYLAKMSGTTQTVLAASQSIVTASDTTMISFSMPCTETLIKQGENLRVVWQVKMVSGGEPLTFGHDPAGRTASAAVTSSRVNIPFKVDI